MTFTVSNQQILYILVKTKRESTAFPKATQKGRRRKQNEVLEETQLAVTLLGGFRAEESYRLPDTDITKSAVYFPGYFENQRFAYQKEELSGIELLTLEEAAACLRFESAKRILSEADLFLHEKSSLLRKKYKRLPKIG